AIVEAKLATKSVGVHTYSAAIEPLENEKNKENNQRNFAVDVIDQQTNVLILSSLVHPDLGALKKSIEHNEQQTADIRYINDGKPLDLGNYQLVVLYQPTADFQEVYDRILRIGINTFTITGEHTDYGFLNW